MALPPVEFFSEALQQVKSVFAKAPPMGVFRDYETGKLAGGRHAGRYSCTVSAMTGQRISITCPCNSSNNFRVLVCFGP